MIRNFSYRRWPLRITAATCTLIIVFLVMQTSMSRGRLAFYPRMDDVMYMARGAELVQAGRNGWAHNGLFGIVASVARDWKREPPHSPWSTGASAIGFSVFGYREWAAYLPTALPVLAFLVYAAKLAYRAGGRWNWRAHALIIFAATAPFLAASVYILKPDYAAGICTAMAMMNLLRGPLLTASRRRLVVTGALLGLALLSKPAMMLPTGMLAAGTLTICTLRDVILGRLQGSAAPGALKRTCLTWLLVLGVMVLVALPHFAMAWRSEWQYARDTLSGKGVEMWGYRGTWGQHALYYLTGPGGRLMLGGLGSLIPIGFTLTVYGFIVFVRRTKSSQRRSVYFVSMLAALGMAWAGPTLSVVKIQQFASCFCALSWLFGIYAAAGICGASRSFRQPSAFIFLTHNTRLYALLTSMCVAALPVSRVLLLKWSFPLWPADRNASARAVRDARDQLVLQTYQAIRTEFDKGARSILTAGGQYDVTSPLLTLWGVRDGAALQVRTVSRKPETDDTSKAEQLGRELLDANNCDLLLVGTGVAGTGWPTVVQADADDFYLRLAQTDTRFELVARIADSQSKAVFELYRRRNANTAVTK